MQQLIPDSSNRSKRAVLTSTEAVLAGNRDIVCFSHLRWESVDDRSQQLLSHCAQDRRVFLIESPVLEFIASWWSDVQQLDCGVWRIVPHLPNWVSDALVAAMQQSLMEELVQQYAIANSTPLVIEPNSLLFYEATPAHEPFLVRQQKAMPKRNLRQVGLQIQ